METVRFEKINLNFNYKTNYVKNYIEINFWKIESKRNNETSNDGLSFLINRIKFHESLGIIGDIFTEISRVSIYDNWIN